MLHPIAFADISRKYFDMKHRLWFHFFIILLSFLLISIHPTLFSNELRAGLSSDDPFCLSLSCSIYFCGCLYPLTLQEVVAKAELAFRPSDRLQGLGTLPKSTATPLQRDSVSIGLCGNSPLPLNLYDTQTADYTNFYDRHAFWWGNWVLSYSRTAKRWVNKISLFDLQKSVKITT